MPLPQFHNTSSCLPKCVTRFIGGGGVSYERRKGCIDHSPLLPSLVRLAWGREKGESEEHGSLETTKGRGRTKLEKEGHGNLKTAMASAGEMVQKKKAKKGGLEMEV